MGNTKTMVTLLLSWSSTDGSKRAEVVSTIYISLWRGDILRFRSQLGSSPSPV